MEFASPSTRRSLLPLLFLVGVALTSFPAAVRAAAFWVNTPSDADDGTCSPQHCTLREAISAANASAGMDEIGFDIPVAGTHDIVLLEPLPHITDSVMLDATTQPGYAGEPVIGITSFVDKQLVGFVVKAPDCVIRGFALHNLWAGIILHGGENGQGRANDAVIEGNWIGLLPSGEHGPSANYVGIEVAANGARIGGTDPLQRNVISGNWGGIHLYHQWLPPASGPSWNLIQGNYIGTEPNGVNAMANGVDGPPCNYPAIMVSNTVSNTVIGGSGAGAGNIISGNNCVGVTDMGWSTAIAGNLIGVNANGDPLGNGAAGLMLSGQYTEVGFCPFGGDSGGVENVVAYNGWSEKVCQAGIHVTHDPALSLPGQACIAGNRIHHNHGLGIQLSEFLDCTGVPLQNDSNDEDDGPNGRMNYPEIISVFEQGADTYFGISFDGPLAPFSYQQFVDISFYASEQCDPSGHGEGEKHIGSKIVPTTAAGDVAPSWIVLPVNIPKGWVVTATATTSHSSQTSEFSRCAVVQPPPR